jgi:hypothetical protein
VKPISKLSFMQGARSPIAAVSALIRLFSNPKRHIRGPFFATTPSNGRIDQPYGLGSEEAAVSACASGALMILFKDEPFTDAPTATRERTRRALEDAASRVYGDNMIAVSDGKGRAAFLRVAKAARKELRAGRG